MHHKEFDLHIVTPVLKRSPLGGQTFIFSKKISFHWTLFRSREILFLSFLFSARETTTLGQVLWARSGPYMGFPDTWPVHTSPISKTKPISKSTRVSPTAAACASLLSQPSCEGDPSLLRRRTPTADAMVRLSLSPVASLQPWLPCFVRSIRLTSLLLSLRWSTRRSRATRPSVRSRPASLLQCFWSCVGGSLLFLWFWWIVCVICAAAKAMGRDLRVHFKVRFLANWLFPHYFAVELM